MNLRGHPDALCEVYHSYQLRDLTRSEDSHQYNFIKLVIYY